MNLSRQDIDQLVKKYHASPNRNDYTIINNWYEQNISNYPDPEYLICIYLFLLGANIKQQFVPFSPDQHRVWVADITKTIENADPMFKMQYKTYLDYATKAGYYK